MMTMMIKLNLTCWWYNYSLEGFSTRFYAGGKSFGKGGEGKNLRRSHRLLLKTLAEGNSLSSNNYLTICSFLQGDVGNQGNLNAFCFLHFFHDLRFKNEKIRIIESSHGTINSPNKHFTDNLYYFKGIHHTWTRKASMWSYPNHSNRPVSS